MNPPGLPAGITFGSAGATGLNDNGQTVVSATLEGAGVVDANNQGIWSEGSGSLQLVAREGDSAPGTSAGVNFSKFRQAVINDAGKVAFQGELAGAGIVSTNENGIWSDRSGALSLVVRGGMPAPGTDTGLDFFDFEPPVMNNTNQLAFRARLAGPGLDLANNDSLWLEDGSGGLNLLVREGDSVPGMAANFVFRRPSQPVLNASGQVAFFAGTYDPNVSFGPPSKSLWIAQPNGDLEMVFSIGDQQIGNQIEVLPGDLRNISGFQFFTGTNQLEGTGQGDGRPSAFNDFGQIALQIDFTDGTEGIFVVSTTTIPEPSSLFFALSFAMSCLVVNSRRGRKSGR